jgi:small subunit ribosomal protein S4
MDRRGTPPGEHSTQFRRKESDFGNQLRAKQKIKRLYGVYEKQFRRYFKRALRMRGVTGETLLILLESRLDNVVYRLNIGESRAQARQLVRHGHVSVNGHKTNIPSFLVKPGDVIAVRDRSKALPFFKARVQEIDGSKVPGWLQLDTDNLSGSVLAAPTRDDIEFTLNEQLVVEFYSR